MIVGKNITKLYPLLLTMSPQIVHLKNLMGQTVLNFKAHRSRHAWENNLFPRTIKHDLFVQWHMRTQCEMDTELRNVNYWRSRGYDGLYLRRSGTMEFPQKFNSGHYYQGRDHERGRLRVLILFVSHIGNFWEYRSKNRKPWILPLFISSHSCFPAECSNYRRLRICLLYVPYQRFMGGSVNKLVLNPRTESSPDIFNIF